MPVPQPLAGQATAGPSLSVGLAKVVVCRRTRCKKLSFTVPASGAIRASLKRAGKTQSTVTRRVAGGRVRLVLRTRRRGAHTVALTLAGATKPLATRRVSVR
jgi:hypothetical protein